MTLRRRWRTVTAVLFRGLDAVRSVEERARVLRQRAAAIPERGQRESLWQSTASPSGDLSDDAALHELGDEAPHRVFAQAGDELVSHLTAVARSRGVKPWHGPVRALDHLERARLLHFHEYALLRDMLTLARDVRRERTTRISARAALDFAHSVLLRSLERASPDAP